MPYPRSPPGVGVAHEVQAYDGRMVKVVGVIKPLEKREISAEGESYEQAREALQEMVPEGWSLQSIMVQR
jgi:hypothetical protein